MRYHWLSTLIVTLPIAVVACAASVASGARWNTEEIEAIRSLWINELSPLAPDPSNRHADDSAAVSLGHKLFFDTRLSSNGRVSCATCHLPDRQFQDDVALASGVGTTNRRTMPLAGTARSTWLFWDGRKDSQWSQALGPLENPVEHGGTRAQYAHVIAQHYRAEYERIFGPFPSLAGVPRVAGPESDTAARAAWDAIPEPEKENVTRVFVNIGKAIAAYERRLEPGPSRFDRYAERLLVDGRAPAGVLSADEEAGLRLFIGKANCTQCHNGPLLTDDHFHNTGVAAVAALPEDLGRAVGAKQVLADEFNCRSRWSDAGEGECAELEFLAPDGHELVRAFKTPTLRGVANRAPYMHAGQVADLSEAIDHYNRAPAAPAGHTEVKPLRLNSRQRAQLGVPAYAGHVHCCRSLPAGSATIMSANCRAHTTKAQGRMQYRLAIFDFDGTLADSFQVFMRAFNTCAGRYSTRRIEAHEIDALRGMSGRALQARLGIAAWKTPFIAREMRRLMAQDLHEVRLFPKIDEVLIRFADAGIMIAIVTSNSEQNVRTVLGEKLAARISDYECGASLFGKAQRFIRTLRRSGIPATSALSIGDEIRDAEAAVEAGIDFGAVTWGYTLPEVLAARSPRMMFKRVEDLLNII